MKKLEDPDKPVKKPYTVWLDNLDYVRIEKLGKLKGWKWSKTLRAIIESYFKE